MFKVVFLHDRSRDDSWSSLFEDTPSNREGRYMSHFERKHFFDLLASGKESLPLRSVTYCYEDGVVPDDAFRIAAKTWWDNTLLIRQIMVALAAHCVKGLDPYKEKDSLMSWEYFWAPFKLASADFAKRLENGNMDDMGTFVQEAWRFVLTQARITKTDYSDLIDEIIGYFYEGP